MAEALNDYLSALDRLKQGKPRVVPRGTKITNDAVALEAGRGKGSIKSSRPMFRDLILAIRDAAAKQAEPQNDMRLRLQRSKAEAQEYRRLYEEAISRELSLLYEIEDLKAKQRRS